MGNRYINVSILRDSTHKNLLELKKVLCEIRGMQERKACFGFVSANSLEVTKVEAVDFAVNVALGEAKKHLRKIREVD